jgi:RNA polymerase sigma factor (sigma-70 family)
MEPDELNQHLSRISTLWTVVCQAKGGPAKEMKAAQDELMRRYRGAVYRYLLGALRDREAADDLTQEFALRFLRGDCGRANPERGRFRDYVKGILFHLITDYHRRKYAQPQAFLADGQEPAIAASAPDEAFGRDFQENWRTELLARAWDALARIEEKTGQPFYSVLRFRVERPELRSPKMAKQLSERLQQPVSASWVRQMLHRGRDRFADLLLGEVADTLSNPTREELEAELADLGLLTYCQPALKRYRRASQ